MPLTNHIIGTVFDITNLEAYYKLDNANDSSGNNRTLSAVGAPTYTETGKYGKCLRLTNTEDPPRQYVYTTSPCNIDGGAITMSFWHKLVTTSGSWRYLCVQQSSNTDTGYAIITYGTLQTFFTRTRVGVGNTNIKWEHDPLPTGVWFNLTLVYDTVTMYGYYNGKIVSTPITASGNGTDPGIDQLVIGTDNYAAPTAQYMNANYDEVIVCSRAWSAQEVYQYYQGNKPTVNMGINY